MRIFVCALGALTLLAACNPSAQTNNPPVATQESVAERQAQAPATGANSFTEEQVRGRLADNGYTSPTQLTQAADGTWRGQATKDGHVANVTVDYQGNIVTSQ